METRTLNLNPKFLHTVRPEALKWNGKQVSVESWHELYPTTETAKMFPNDDTVGFVKELAMDFPKSELT